VNTIACKSTGGKGGTVGWSKPWFGGGVCLWGGGGWGGVGVVVCVGGRVGGGGYLGGGGGFFWGGEVFGGVLCGVFLWGRGFLLAFGWVGLLFWGGGGVWLGGFGWVGLFVGAEGVGWRFGVAGGVLFRCCVWWVACWFRRSRTGGRTVRLPKKDRAKSYSCEGTGATAPYI